MARINTLLLSGANNHDWERHSPFFEKLLRDSGRFDVTTTLDPSAAMADAGELAKYDLLFDDYNGPEWSDQAKANFVSFVADGGGLVILHAANNAFHGWVEFEILMGLSFREGAGHGDFHEFEVEIVDREHPITKGVDNFMQTDELYHGMKCLHNAPYHLLATAHSSPDKGGTGKDEAMMLVVEHGKGRVFHQILGHLWPGDPNGAYKGASLIALEGKGFQRTLLRGCEWAATGEVTLP